MKAAKAAQAGATEGSVPGLERVAAISSPRRKSVDGLLSDLLTEIRSRLSSKEDPSRDQPRAPLEPLSPPPSKRSLPSREASRALLPRPPVVAASVAASAQPSRVPGRYLSPVRRRRASPSQAREPLSPPRRVPAAGPTAAPAAGPAA